MNKTTKQGIKNTHLCSSTEHPFLADILKMNSKIVEMNNIILAYLSKPKYELRTNLKKNE
jgi:hypothetical protein